MQPLVLLRRQWLRSWRPPIYPRPSTLAEELGGVWQRCDENIKIWSFVSLRHMLLTTIWASMISWFVKAFLVCSLLNTCHGIHLPKYPKLWLRISSMQCCDPFKKNIFWCYWVHSWEFYLQGPLSSTLSTLSSLMSRSRIEKESLLW